MAVPRLSHLRWGQDLEGRCTMMQTDRKNLGRRPMQHLHMHSPDDIAGTETQLMLQSIKERGTDRNLPTLTRLPGAL